MGLAITKRVGEHFIIGDDIKITVRRVVSNRVMLDIEAPLNVKIRRGEDVVDENWEAPGLPPGMRTAMGK